MGMDAVISCGTASGESGRRSPDMTRVGSPSGPEDARPATDGDGFAPLFDGRSIANWRMAGSGRFVVVDGRLESVPGDDLGLFWCTQPSPADFVLKLAWLCWRQEDASGVFVRFPEPRAGKDGNAAFVAIQQGFEVQIDECGIPGATSIHKTGAIFNEPGQQITPRPARPPATWNEFEIAVRGDQYLVHLNGEQVSSFVNTTPSRGRPTTPNAPSFIGLQVYPGSRVAFRNIRLKAL
jgi:3-keto-disaccharide hydrolase